MNKLFFTKMDNDKLCMYSHTNGPLKCTVYSCKLFMMCFYESLFKFIMN